MPLGVEHFDPLVAGVGDADVLGIGTNASMPLNCPAVAGRAPLLDEVSVLVELRDPVRVAEAVRDVDVAGLVPTDVGRTIEGGAGRAGSRRRRLWTTASAACSRSRRQRAAAVRCAAACARSGAASPVWCPTSFRSAASASRRSACAGRCRRRAEDSRTHRAGGPRRGAGPDVDGFRFAAEHERDPAVRVELHHLAGADVDRPDVVLRIDADAVRRVEPVDVLAELADELAILIELEQAGAASIERAVVTQRRVGMSRPRVDEDLAF